MKYHDLKQVEQRVKRYWYSDGIAEIASGGMFLLLGLYFGVLGYFEQGSLVSVILQVSMVLIFMAGAFGVRWLVNHLKARVTYPRTGYVEYRMKDSASRSRRIVIVVTAMLISAASIFLADYFRDLNSMVLITGLLVGVIFVALRGRSSGLKRFYLLGSLAFLLGIGLALSKLEQLYTLALFYGLLGIATLISGGWVLKGYLAENPPQMENHDE